jgi:hypothetical protein
LGKKPAGAKTLAKIALILARAIDEGGPIAARAKLAQELRITIMQLREAINDQLADQGADGAGTTPVWDAADAEPADVGSAGGGGSRTAG